MKYPLINVSEIPDEGTVLVDFFGRQVHVYKTDGRPVAVANVCMHFGGPLDYKDNCTFVCQWHQASFDARDGRRLDGPSPAASKLMFLSTRVEGDVLNYIWGE